MSTTLSHNLHLSLARECVRKAVSFYRQAREDAWSLTKAQMDELGQSPDAAKRDARAHIAAANGAVRPRVVRRSCRDGGGGVVPVSDDRRTAFETQVEAE